MELKSSNLVCWQCGASLADEPLPLSTYAECRNCRAALHVCRLCRFDNPNLRSDCDEPRAESVIDREKANFCDWFKPTTPTEVVRTTGASVDARARLDSLFADLSESEGSATGDSRETLESLFNRHDE